MSLLLVFSNPTPGDDAEYNRWYQEVHLKEVLEVPGFVAAQRFELTDAQMGDAERPHRYLAIYEVDGDPELAFKNIQAASPKMDMSKTLDANTFVSHFTPIGARVTA